MYSIPYNRDAAIIYAEKWALSRNPVYYNFSGIGGDCTNFVSQCLYAGGRVMNYTPVTGWYYISAMDRSAAWTGVSYLYSFLTGNKSVGPYGTLTERDGITPGDIVQLSHADATFYHTLLVLAADDSELYVAAHNIDSLWRPLSNYDYSQIRYIHIEGIRTY